MDSSILEMKEESWVMRLMCWVARMVMAKGFDGKADDSDPSFKMMMTMATDCALRAVGINAAIPDRFIRGLLEMANGHGLRGIKVMLFG